MNSTYSTLAKIAWLLSGIIALSAHAQTSTLTGHIEGIGKQPIIFWYDVDGTRHRDTVYATNDRFTYQPQPSDDGTIDLFISAPRFTHFWYEPGQITVTGNAKTPHKLTFKGTPENEILANYQQEIEWKNFGKQKEKKAISQFVQDYPASLTATERLYRIVSAAEEDDEIYQKIWNTLSSAMQASQYGKMASQKIEILKTQPIVGRVAPNFTIPDTAGIDVSLSDFRGKYVLLDFWGHWCSGCIWNFPKIAALHKKYGDKIEVVGIALEYEHDKDKWLTAIQKHKAYWTQLSDLKGEAGLTDLQYNISEYPTYILLDKEGVVLERSTGLDKIERRLTSLKDL